MPNLTMKKILTILLAGVSTLAIAQKRAHLSRSVDDDGKKLTIKVTGTIDGKEVDFDKSFDVEGLDKYEREALRERVLTSISSGNLDLQLPKARCEASASADLPKPPAPPAPEAMAFSSNEVNAEMVSSGKGFMKEPVATDPKGYSKHVRYNPETGEMFLKYRFMKNADEYIYEKTVDAAEKSDKERSKIVDSFESEIGLPGKGMEM